LGFGEYSSLAPKPLGKRGREGTQRGINPVRKREKQGSEYEAGKVGDLEFEDVISIIGRKATLIKKR